MPKRGHVPIVSTVRQDESTLLDNLTEELEAKRQRRALHPETYLPTDGSRVTRAGLIRAAVRYAMERRADFELWLNNGESR